MNASATEGQTPTIVVTARLHMLERKDKRDFTNLLVAVIAIIIVLDDTGLCYSAVGRVIGQYKQSDRKQTERKLIV